MYDRVVPGRYRIAGIVPAGRDIAVGPRENRQHLSITFEQSGLWIVAGHMGRQGSVGALVAIEDERDVARIGRTPLHADQNAERAGIDQVVEGFCVGDFKALGNEHSGSSLQMCASMPEKQNRRGKNRGGCVSELSADDYRPRSTIIFLMDAMALAGLRLFGQVFVQFMIVWQR